MRVFACLWAASLALAGAAEAAPRRVASLNLCTDELLLMLGDPAQIASVTHLAQQPAETSLWRAARRHPRNDGSLLSVAAMKPDLVLTMGGGVRDRAGIAARIGVRTLDLPFPQSLDDVDRSIATVAAALGRQARGAALRARLRTLVRSRPVQSVETVWLGGNGRSLAADGLGGQWMALAGFRQRRLNGDRITLEQLLMRPPAVLLRSDYRAGQYSGEQRWLSHPLAKGAARSRNVVTDGRPWTCMGPVMIGEIERLRARR